MQAPGQHLEIERLRKKCRSLRTDLRATAERWHQLSVEERPRLTGLYDSAFGQLERERQRLVLESTEIFRRVELLTIKATRGETITPEIVELVNMVVDKEYQRMRQRLRDVLDLPDIDRNGSSESSDGDGDLVDMYRTLAKQFHPDASEESDENLAAWHRVQRAYHDRDASHLKTLLKVLGTDEKDATEVDTWDVERWQREEQELGARLRMERRKLDRMMTQEPFSIAEQLENPEWRDRHRAEIENDIEARKAEIEKHEEKYRVLSGERRALSGERRVESAKLRAENSERRDENDDFNKDFMENTYFGGR